MPLLVFVWSPSMFLTRERRGKTDRAEPPTGPRPPRRGRFRLRLPENQQIVPVKAIRHENATERRRPLLSLSWDCESSKQRRIEIGRARKLVDRTARHHRRKRYEEVLVRERNQGQRRMGRARGGVSISGNATPKEVVLIAEAPNWWAGQYHHRIKAAW